jgi:hypothetical protein
MKDLEYRELELVLAHSQIVVLAHCSVIEGLQRGGHSSKLLRVNVLVKSGEY